MAYAVRFRFEWRSNNDNVYKIEILQDGYSGSVVKRPLGGAPQLRRNKNGNICGTSLEFLAQATVDGEFAVLYTSDPQAFRVDLYQNDTLIWQGFVTPELYSEPYIAPPYNVKVTATDNLGELKLTDFAAQGRKSISAMLTYILGYTGLGFSAHWINTMRPASPSVTAANMPSSTYVNLDHMEGKTLYDVLAAILKTFHATIVQYNCGWVIVRETDIENRRSDTTITATDGTTYSLGDFGSMATSTWWPIGYLSQTVVPAKAEKVITAPNNWIENLLPSTATSATNATYYSPTDGDTPYYELVPWDGSQQYSQASIAFWSSFSEFVPTKDLTLSLVLQTFGVLSGHTYGKKCAAVTVKIVGSDGSSYINCWLGADGNLTTTSSEALDIYAVGQDAAEAYNLVLPVYSQMSTMGYTKVYQIQVTLASTDAEDGISRMRLFTWNCNVPEQNKGYQVTCVLNNGARGTGDDVELPVCDNADKSLESVFITNGLRTSSAVISTWTSSAISSMALLEFLARDYCLSIATPRLLMEGAINVPNATTLPLLFRGGGLIYWPDTYDWNLVDDALNVSMTSLPASAITVTSVTRTAEGSDGMVVSSGGSSSSGGSGGGTGTVTAVAMTVPTGMEVTGSPITTSGTLALSIASGYVLPTDQATRYWYAAYDAMHTHSNKTVLDGITSTDITNWDTAATNSHTHSNKTTLDDIEASDLTHWDDAYDAMHTHSNKAILDAITSAPATENNYITEFTWSGGTTAGPTASISRSGLSAISVSAIPSASSSASGVVTTGSQTFAGDKTFTGDVTSQATLKGASLVIPTSQTSESDSQWYISIDASTLSGGLV